MENTGKQQLLDALVGSLSEEQKVALAHVLAEGGIPVKKNPPASPKAGKVYFFRQLVVVETVEIKAKSEDGKTDLQKTVNVLPPRVIAVDEKNAWRLYWKGRSRFVFLGSSDGETWRGARVEGKSIGEAQMLEYEEMLKNPDMTPPMNKEKTVFVGSKISQITRGIEGPWEGLKSQRN